MKKQKIQIFSLMVLIVLLVVAYFVLPKFVKEEEYTTEKYTVTAIDTNAVTEFSFINEGEEYGFVKEDGTWYAKHDKTLSLSQESIENLVQKVSTVESNTKIEGVTDFTQYGLTEPLHIVKVTTDSENYTIVMGDYNEITGEYYLYLEGEKVVYTVETVTVNGFNTTLDELVEVEEETGITE